MKAPAIIAVTLLTFVISNYSQLGQQWIVSLWSSDPTYAKRSFALYVAGITKLDDTVDNPRRTRCSSNGPQCGNLYILASNNGNRSWNKGFLLSSWRNAAETSNSSSRILRLQSDRANNPKILERHVAGTKREIQ